MEVVNFASNEERLMDYLSAPGSFSTFSGFHSSYKFTISLLFPHPDCLYCNSTTLFYSLWHLFHVCPFFSELSSIFLSVRKGYLGVFPRPEDVEYYTDGQAPQGKFQTRCYRKTIDRNWLNSLWYWPFHMSLKMFIRCGYCWKTNGSTFNINGKWIASQTLQMDGVLEIFRDPPFSVTPPGARTPKLRNCGRLRFPPNREPRVLLHSQSALWCPGQNRRRPRWRGSSRHASPLTSVAVGTANHTSQSALSFTDSN